MLPRGTHHRITPSADATPLSRALRTHPRQMTFPTTPPNDIDTTFSFVSVSLFSRSLPFVFSPSLPLFFLSFCLTRYLLFFFVVISLFVPFFFLLPFHNLACGLCLFVPSWLDLALHNFSFLFVVIFFSSFSLFPFPSPPLFHAFFLLFCTSNNDLGLSGTMPMHHSRKT